MAKTTILVPDRNTTASVGALPKIPVSVSKPPWEKGP
jgi:hypothetical protein